MELVNTGVGLSQSVYESEEASEEMASLDRFFADPRWTGVNLDRKSICINAAIGFGAHVLLDSVVSRINRVGSQDAKNVDLRLLVCVYELISTIDELVLRELFHQGFGLEDSGKLSKKIVKHLLVGIVFAKFYGSPLLGRGAVCKEISNVLFGCALVFLRSCTGNQVAPTVLYVLNILKNMRELGVLKKA